MKDFNGKNILVVCRWWFDSGVDVPTSGGRTLLSTQKQQQEATTKRKQIYDAVTSGHRKGRKM